MEDMVMFNCIFCNKEGKSANSLRNHQRLCHSNPDRQVSSFTWYNENRVAWNKGLSQKDFPSLARPNQKGVKFGAALTGHTEEAKRKISQKLSINNKGGRAKWYDVAGQKVQGTWERNVALKFEELGIEWKKLKTNRDALEYIMDDKVRCYTPDFFLPTYNVFLEVKGHWWGRDREKMDIVLKTYPDKNIVIVEKVQYEKFLGGELVW